MGIRYFPLKAYGLSYPLIRDPSDTVTAHVSPIGASGTLPNNDDDDDDYDENEIPSLMRLSDVR